MITSSSLGLQENEKERENLRRELCRSQEQVKSRVIAITNLNLETLERSTNKQYRYKQTKANGPDVYQLSPILLIDIRSIFDRSHIVTLTIAIMKSSPLQLQNARCDLFSLATLHHGPHRSPPPPVDAIPEHMKIGLFQYRNIHNIMIFQYQNVYNI